MDIDVEKLFRYLKWQNREQITRLARKGSMSHDLLKQTMKNWIRYIFTYNNDRGGREYLMKGVEILKYTTTGIPNHSRFLKPMDDFNAEFNRQISNQKFLQ